MLSAFNLLPSTAIKTTVSSVPVSSAAITPRTPAGMPAPTADRRIAECSWSFYLLRPDYLKKAKMGVVFR